MTLALKNLSVLLSVGDSNVIKGVSRSRMAQAHFKYEVAFSFLKEDESIATAINDLLQDRLSTFLYSRRQEELAGTDGEESFGKVFGQEARIVVVLYRNSWGKTFWTRIEETAIRNRAFQEGYDFAVFAPVENDVTLPRWLPMTQIWIGLQRWGIEGAASVIEARVQQAGGSPQEESVSARAVRLKRQMNAETERARFLKSAEGVNAASCEAKAFFDHLEESAIHICTETGFELTPKRVQQGIELCAAYGCLALDWVLRFSNSLDESYLYVELWEGKPDRPGRYFFNTPLRRSMTKYSFDRLPTGELGWRRTDMKKFLNSQRLSDACLKLLVDHSHAEHIKRGD